MSEFNLFLKISPSDSQFKKNLGDEKYTKLKAKVLEENEYKCCGCGYKPLDEKKAGSILNLHVISVNEENLEESECNCLCKACHTTQHIDVALSMGWVQLVNSTFSQKTLIEMCRINSVYNSIQDDSIRYIKKSPEEFLEKLRAGSLPAPEKSKVIFTTKFEWGDL